MEREEACAAIPLPGSMSAPLAGYEWARDHVGESGGSVYRLHGKPDAPDLFLKHGCSSVADDVTDEMIRYVGWRGTSRSRPSKASSPCRMRHGC